jgi:hypothetical protein
MSLLGLPGTARIVLMGEVGMDLTGAQVRPVRSDEM